MELNVHQASMILQQSMGVLARIDLQILKSLDAIRHAIGCRNGVAVLLWLSTAFGKRESRLYRAMNFCESAALWRLLCTQLPPDGFPPSLLKELVSSLPRYRTLLEESPALTRSIVLKAPSEVEKGVLFVHFEYNWARLACGLSSSEFKWLDEHFDLILSTSWSPTDYAALALVLSLTKGPVFVQPCNYGDIDKLHALHPRISCLDSLPCDWINPDFYPPVSFEDRPIDLLMVANWGEFKRHWNFFETLRRMPADLRVVLVGQREGGRDETYIQRLASQMKVPQKLEIHQSLPVSEVAKLQSSAKVSVIFSRREGCCVAAAESLFAGCALAMREDAHVGPLAYINSRTGRRLRLGHLADDLTTLLEEARSLDSAAWARENIGFIRTNEKVNRHLRDSSLERGFHWTRDLAPHYWHPFPIHGSSEDANCLKPVYELLHNKFPKVFSGDLIKNSRL